MGHIIAQRVFITSKYYVVRIDIRPLGGYITFIGAAYHDTYEKKVPDTVLEILGS